MFESKETPTILFLSEGEWESIGDGFCEGIISPTLAKFIVPQDYIGEKHYWKVANMVGRIGKLCIYAIAIRFFGIATGGLI